MSDWGSENWQTFKQSFLCSWPRAKGPLLTLRARQEHLNKTFFLRKMQIRQHWLPTYGKVSIFDKNVLGETAQGQDGIYSKTDRDLFQGGQQGRGEDNPMACGWLRACLQFSHCNSTATPLLHRSLDISYVHGSGFSINVVHPPFREVGFFHQLGRVNARG